MKGLKKVTRKLALLLVVVLISTTVLPVGYGTTKSEAASVTINKKTAVLAVGKTLVLKISGTTSKVAWSSSNKSVAIVDQKGKVTGKAKGAATITGTVAGKKYICKVTVKSFEEKKITFEKASFNIPKTWANEIQETQGIKQLLLYPKGKDKMTSSGVTALIIPTGQSKPKMSQFKEVIKKTVTAESQKKAIETQLGLKDLELTNFKLEFSEKYNGIMSRTSFSIGLDGEVGRKYIAYDLFLDGYQINVSCIDILDSIKPDLDLVAKNLLSTLKIK